jgi:hypothetical protein
MMFIDRIWMEEDNQVIDDGFQGEPGMTDYKADLIQRYWEYQKSKFDEGESYFERPYVQDKRPPVFVQCEAWRNILIDPEASQEEIGRLLAMVPDGERHKWYRSMNSSQALAQSIFGNLATHGYLACLSELKDDEGMDLFGKAKLSADNFEMEHKIDYLGEPRHTSVDGYIAGDYRVAIECKFTEADIGTCSRPRLTQADVNFESEHCNGTYSIQRARKERCSLTEVGVRYWQYVPSLFNWENDRDLDPCPLYRNYQLVRNVLAAGVQPDGSTSLDGGHVVLIYDERNPAFQRGGKGLVAYLETQKALREPRMLRKCSWQRMLQTIRDKNILPWLTENLALKYGL